jgi:hypothetical protein
MAEMRGCTTQGRSDRAHTAGSDGCGAGRAIPGAKAEWPRWGSSAALEIAGAQTQEAPGGLAEGLWDDTFREISQCSSGASYFS